ncbi:amino acid permease-domain-containing protein [Fusarium tricinctum]|uniref:Amino acid permease-domain-containing protein n=1 Tax=Fusarium tricinctum TaxID=61284 RepID=A0A8K0W912_9HYPO|nr:amino acid permease-domain-containing protein [Fusarium tricinctum]
MSEMASGQVNGPNIALDELAPNTSSSQDISRSNPGILNDDHSAPSDGLNATSNPPTVLRPGRRGVTEVPQLPIHTVRRKLRGIHIFMIAINGTLGTGLYVRSGQILELGGPIAVVLSFITLGILVWAVMQCIAELLCLWPVPGAVPLFVKKFVDRELGDAVGIAYWFTYSIGFSALITTSASVLNFWTADMEGFTEGFVYVALPITLVAINSVKVEIYGWLEVITGIIKLIFLAIIIICLIYIGNLRWNEPFKNDDNAASGWFEGFMMCLSIATFAYTGVENIAVSVIEARWPSVPGRPRSCHDSSQGLTSENSSPPRQLTAIASSHKAVKKTLGFTAVFLPIFVAFAYTISGLLITLSLKRDKCGLQRLASLKNKNCTEPDPNKRGFTYSPFIIIAQDSKIDNLDNVFNAFIVFTALTCANTNLYVASRTLFGITRNIRSREYVPRLLSWFGVTDRNRVPLRAMAISAVAFCWVPFLQRKESFNTGSTLGKFVEILVQMGSVSVVIVWACLCLAYIRYYYCIHMFRDALAREGIHLARDREQESEAYPYQSHWQPVLAGFAFTGCLVILLICNGVFLWKEFHIIPFCSGYLTVIAFLVIWIGLKVYKGVWSPWTRLDANIAINIIRDLNELRDKSLQQPAGGFESRWTAFKRGLRRRGNSAN